MKKIAFAALLAPLAVLVTDLRQSIQTSKEIKQNAGVIDHRRTGFMRGNRALPA